MNIDHCLLHASYQGIKPTTQASAPSGKRTDDLLMHGAWVDVQQLSYPNWAASGTLVNAHSDPKANSSLGRAALFHFTDEDNLVDDIPVSFKAALSLP